MARLGRAQPFKPLFRRFRVVGADITLALTGVAATCAVGTLGVALALGPTGVSSTTAVGSVGVGLSAGLSGSAATGSVGTVVPDRALSPTGVAGTGSPGSLTPGVAIGLSGIPATGAVGTVSLAGDQTASLSGCEATGSPGTLRPGISLALSGVSTTLSPGSVVQSRQVPLVGVPASGVAGTVVASGGTPAGSRLQQRTSWARNILTDAPAGWALVRVTEHATETLVALYEADGETLKMNPFYADPDTGIYSWSAENGRYDETVTPIEGEGEAYTNPDLLLYNPPV
jgi:hypothetical protein